MCVDRVARYSAAPQIVSHEHWISLLRIDPLCCALHNGSWTKPLRGKAEYHLLRFVRTIAGARVPSEVKALTLVAPTPLRLPRVVATLPSILLSSSMSSRTASRIVWWAGALAAITCSVWAIWPTAERSKVTISKWGKFGIRVKSGHSATGCAARARLVISPTIPRLARPAILL
jgi:hypothetical protein